ncbi:hypothetical protein EYR41_002723 [Orbilia oligospora]|uniref:Uncharacterized protein n=1 Tax=Orbilia oligospora TaxID=2813651 RepID=A0A8H2HQS5_ORBOL|nr:hypothetical protein EYR41_002723 [Orbilia oligospora]
MRVKSSAGGSDFLSSRRPWVKDILEVKPPNLSPSLFADRAYPPKTGRKANRRRSIMQAKSSCKSLDLRLGWRLLGAQKTPLNRKGASGYYHWFGRETLSCVSFFELSPEPSSQSRETDKPHCVAAKPGQKGGRVGGPLCNQLALGIEAASLIIHLEATAEPGPLPGIIVEEAALRNDRRRTISRRGCSPSCHTVCILSFSVLSCPVLVPRMDHRVHCHSQNKII